MKSLKLSFVFALLLALFTVAPVLAGGGHIYGIVYLDHNLNQSWDNEPGVADIRVHFVSGDTHIVLNSAWTDMDGEEGPDMYCSHLEEWHVTVPKGCNGTFGLVEAGWGWWDVYIDVPAGYQLSSPYDRGTADNPIRVMALGEGGSWYGYDESYLEIGLVPAPAVEPGAGGNPAYNGQYVFTASELEVDVLTDLVVSGPYKVDPLPY